MKREQAVIKMREYIQEFALAYVNLNTRDPATPGLLDEYLTALLVFVTKFQGLHPEGQEWYDHRYDWFRGPQNWTGYERLVMGMQHIQTDDRVLDLCCGDGLFAGACAGSRARLVHGVDIDARAIAAANRWYRRKNVKFYVLDIVTDCFPLDLYTIITWFEGLEHITNADAVLKKIVAHLALTGKLIGSTPIIVGNATSNQYHVNGFCSVKELRACLDRYFTDVVIYTSKWTPKRTQMYFVCCNNQKDEIS